jgi:GH25 family lysozyme M1 (1,4-beta-N-acetylmuramidase)
MPRIGPDISHFQEKVNLARAKGHVDFVFLKATDGKKTRGAMFVDRTFAPRWRQLADLGIPRGAYHYARPNTSPADQAAHFIAVVQASGFRAGDVAILDMEDRKASRGLSPSALRKWVDRWVAEVRRALPVQDVVLYTGIPYWTSQLGDPSRLPAGCIGMIARYNRRGPFVRPPGRPRAWPDPPAIWQFTDGKKGRVTHIPGLGKVDTSEMTEAAFDRLFEEDDFTGLFDNLNGFKDAVRAVVRDEVGTAVQDELKGFYALLARGGDPVPGPTDDHFKDSHRGVNKQITDIYMLLARGEADGQINPAGVHFKDSNRHLAQLLGVVATATGAKLPEPPP